MNQINPPTPDSGRDPVLDPGRNPGLEPGLGPVLGIAAVLFDMGGVLVELSPFDKMLGLEGLSSAEFWAKWLASPAVRALESGKITAEDFAVMLTAELELTLAPGQLMEKFRSFPSGLFPGAVDLVASVPDHIVTGILSNTNAIHWETQIDAPIVQGLCQRRYLSYEMGLNKPDRETFDYVVADLGLSADRVLFIDDSPANVAGARAAGLHSEVTRGPEEGAAVLVAYGVAERSG